MSANQSLPSVIAFQLAAALDAYEVTISRLVARPADGELYEEARALMDRMRMYAAGLPPVAVPWVEVMIAHFELTHALWRVQLQGAQDVDIRALHEHLSASLSRLARHCLHLLPQA